MDRSPDSGGCPPRRGVILGASNATRGIATAVPAAVAALGGPLDLLAAIGHGRGYARRSCVLGRTLPSIASCGLWSALAARPPAEISCGLLTDVGNDLLYGATVEETAASVEACLERLAAACQRIAIAELPLAALATVSRGRYLICRALLFPTSALTFESAAVSAEELNQRLVEMAARYGAVLQRPQPSWYGFDPIHIRRAVQASAWQQLLSAWGPAPPGALPRSSWGQWCRLRWQRPQQRWLFGIAQRRSQPACRLGDGSCVSLF